MREIVLQLIMAFIGSFGFSMIFRLRKNLWCIASMGGVFCWGAYLLAMYFTGHIFVSGLLASALAAFYADMLAVRKEAPTPLFLIPSVVPLIPGSTLYYTMSAAVQGNASDVSRYGSLTIQYALSIAAGICIVWTILSILRRFVSVIHSKDTVHDRCKRF